MKRLFALLGGVLLLVIGQSASALGHNPAGACSGDIRIIVYEHNDYGGVWDDFCGSVATNPPGQFAVDPHFSQNNANDDIGDAFLMAGFVSSFSVHNLSGTKTYAVCFHPDPNFGGIPLKNGKILPGDSWHAPSLGVFYNDTLDSLRISPHQGGC